MAALTHQILRPEARRPDAAAAVVAALQLPAQETLARRLHVSGCRGLRTRTPRRLHSGYGQHAVQGDLERPRAVVRCGRSPTTNLCPSRPCSAYPAHWAKCCSTMDVATVTLSEAVPSPYCGMYTKASHAAICFSLRPWPCRTAGGLSDTGCEGTSPRQLLYEGGKEHKSTIQLQRHSPRCRS